MKKATTVDEQIEKLKSRGMVLDLGEDKVREILLDIGYYRLGFYCFPFEKTYPSLRNRTHEYKEGSCISDVIRLYYLDFDLRHLLIKYLNRIEVHFRTNVTYWISNEYPDQNAWFVDPAVMSRKYVAEFDAKIYDGIKCKNKALKEHHAKYINDRYAPAWKTVEFLTFGAIVNIYDNLKSEGLKKKIAFIYGLTSHFTFYNYMSAIKEIRNACAHGSVLFDHTLPQSLKKGPAVNLRLHSKNNLYSSILVIEYILSKISKNRAVELRTELERVFNSHKESPHSRSVIVNQIGYSYE